MATCPNCRGLMGQTAAVCGQCGYDFPPPTQRPWWTQQSTLRDWLLVLSVLGIPCAYLHYARAATNPWLIAGGLVACSLLCARLLHRWPLWTTLFEALALGALVALFALAA